MTAPDRSETALKALSMLDLTDLGDQATEEGALALIRSADTGHGFPAAICIWPRFVAAARAALGPDHSMKIATVVNFPSGTMAASDVAAETIQAIADGADEIDLVIPYRALMAGDEKAVSEMIETVRGVCVESVRLKTILETGELAEPGLIRNASHLAISAGADFIKTSTGKVPINATIDAADIMLSAIRESGKPVGFKAAGGVRTVEDAARYLALADTIMGKGWATPATFRFGASGLLSDILAAISGADPAPAAEGRY
jgi:deoxyribose-phosphate aldolase